MAKQDSVEPDPRTRLILERSETSVDQGKPLMTTAAESATDQQRWGAVAAQDHLADGRGANKEAVRFGVAECSLGSLLVAATARGVCAILLGDDPRELVRELQRRFARAELMSGDPQFQEWMAEVVELVEDSSPAHALPLDIRGTNFQRLVWQALKEIPVGSTASYAQIAQQIGRPGAVRAVAGACAANHLAVAIPCHRVVRSDGSLSGYRWGVERKRALLHKEAVPAPFVGD